MRFLRPFELRAGAYVPVQAGGFLVSNGPQVLTKNEIEYFMSLMNSGDANIQRDGLQRLYQEVQKGRRLLPFSRQRLEPSLRELIRSPVPKVRKWALHLATELNSEKITEICRDQLSEEQDIENVNWILAALSKRYEKSQLLEFIRQAKGKNPLLDDISELQIHASTVLFSKERVGEISKIVQDLRSSTPNIRSWLTKLYGYHTLAQKRDMDGLVTQKDMLDLITDGDTGLQEYGMWGLHLHGAQDTRAIPRDLLEESSYCDDTLKWFFPFVQYIQDLASDQDRIVSWVRRWNFFNRSAREGLLNLLLRLDYSPKYMEPLIDWYAGEEYPSVRRLLIQYMISNVAKDDTETFFAVIEGEFYNVEVRTIIECEIRLNPGTALEIADNRIQPKEEWGAMSKQKFGNISVSGTVKGPLIIQQGETNSNLSPVSPSNFDYQAVAEFLTQVKGYDLSAGELGVHASELQSALEAVKAAVDRQEPPSKIRTLLETVRDLAVGIGGSLIASGIAAQVPALMQQLGF